MAMIQKADLVFVTGDNIDAAHPYGDIDRIDYTIGRYGERQNDGILAGVDIVFLNECYYARDTLWSGIRDSHTFYRKIYYDSIANPVSRYNDLMGTRAPYWCYYPDSYYANIAAHRVSSSYLHVARPDLFWGSKTKYPIAHDGIRNSPLRLRYLTGLYSGLDYFRICEIPLSSGVEYDLNNFQISITTTDQTHGSFSPKSSSDYQGLGYIYVYDCYGREGDSRWDYYVNTGRATGNLTITKAAWQATGIAKYVKRVKPVYKIHYFAYFRNENNRKEYDRSYGTVAVGGTWRTVGQNLSFDVSPYLDTNFVDWVTAYGEVNPRPPQGTPSSASGEYLNQYMLSIDSIYLLVELTDNICGL